MENSSSVVVKLELGHHASLRSEKTPEGFTHDWTVFVRGPDGINIQHFIDKVVFFLHEDFPKPKRVIKEPPYQVSESGYAGFILPIEVHFKNKEEPKKVTFNYDLYLTFGPPVSNIRCEKLTFQNPTDDFRRKLMKAGGTAYSGGNSEVSNSAAAQAYCSTTASQEKREHSSDSQKLATSKSSHRNQDKKKYTSSKEATKNQPHGSHPFTDIFGTPIKRKSSPDEIPPKQKEATAGGTHSSHTKPNKVPSSSHSSSNLASSTKESKVGRPAKEKSPHKERKDAKHAKSSKLLEKEIKQPNVKRQVSPAHTKETTDKKRKRTTSASSENNSLTPQPAACAEKKDSSKSKHKESKLKEKHKSKPVKSEDVSISVSSYRNEKTKEKVSTDSIPKPGKKPADHIGGSPVHEGSQGLSSMWSDKNSNVHSEEKGDPPSLESKEDSVMNMDDFNSSPSSSISLSSLPPGGSHGPLATMMAEMEKEPLSPLSSDPGSPLSSSPVSKDRSEDNVAEDSIVASAVEFANRTMKEEPEEQPCIKKKIDVEDTDKDKKSDVQRVFKTKKEVKTKRDDTDETRSPHERTNVDDNSVGNIEERTYPDIDPAYAKELRELQQKIMQLTDRGIIQKIVDVIEETGEFQITSTAFEFELLKLDQITVRKLQDCFV